MIVHFYSPPCAAVPGMKIILIQARRDRGLSTSYIPLQSHKIGIEGAVQNLR